MTYFDFPLNSQQAEAFEKFKQFAHKDHPPSVFLLRGYAGTGKTTLVKGLIQYLHDDTKHNHIELLATTGRAAKVLADKSNTSARTIHSMVYQFKGVNHDILLMEEKSQKLSPDNEGLQLRLDFRPRKYVPQESSAQTQRFYFVDECSMLTDKKGVGASFARFGDGRLLNDLLQYDLGGKYVFIGDPCQLPPVNDRISPALEQSYLATHHKKTVIQVELSQVMRQQGENHQILAAATGLRNTILTSPPKKGPATLQIRQHEGLRLHLHTNLNELYKQYLTTLRTHGDTYMALICHTNRQRQGLNRLIRKELRKPPHMMQPGDLLMATQNTTLAPIVNGDLLRVKEIGPYERRAGLTFIRVKVTLIHKPKVAHELLLIEKVLDAATINIDENEHRQLLIDFTYRMKDQRIKQGTELFETKMREDPYLNALRAVYGYAVTAHKAQGGEWPEVYVWQESTITRMPPQNTYRWWYTVLTRAIEKIHFANAAFIS